MADPKPSNSSKAIGLRIKKLCAENYKSKSECARAYGVLPQNWTKIETGKVRFDSEELYRLAGFFQVDPAWLLTGRNAQSKAQQEQPAEAEVQEGPRPAFNAARWNNDVDIAASAHAFRVVGEAAADESRGSRAGYFGENDRTIWDNVEVPETTRFVRIIGDSMSPVLLGGQYAMVGPEYTGSSAPHDRDIVVASVFVEDNEQDELDRQWEGVYCKRVVDEGDYWLFVSINPIGAPFTILKSHCRLWPVIGVWFAGKGKPPLED